MIGRTWASFNIQRQPFAAEHNRRRQWCSRLGSSSSSSSIASSSSDAPIPAEGAVMDRLLTSRLPNEIMIMKTRRPVSGQPYSAGCLSVAGAAMWPTRDLSCMHQAIYMSHTHTHCKNYCVVSWCLQCCTLFYHVVFDSNSNMACSHRTE